MIAIKCATFSTFCAISCDSSAHFLQQRRGKDTNEMALEITSVEDEQIPGFLSSLPPLNLRQDFDNFSKCEDCERDSANVKHRNESVIHKSSDEEM